LFAGTGGEGAFFRDRGSQSAGGASEHDVVIRVMQTRIEKRLWNKILPPGVGNCSADAWSPEA
jgi:hypothetical protein